MESSSAVMCINIDLPPTASCERSSGPVLVLTKVVRLVGWGYENKAFCFSKQYAFKRVLHLHHKTVVHEKVRPHNRLALFSLPSYHCALPPADSRDRFTVFTSRKVDENMSDYDTDDEDIAFSTEPRGYLYEPEYTDAELRQIESERAEREREKVGTEKWFKKQESQVEP